MNLSSLARPGRSAGPHLRRSAVRTLAAVALAVAVHGVVLTWLGQPMARGSAASLGRSRASVVVLAPVAPPAVAKSTGGSPVHAAAHPADEASQPAPPPREESVVPRSSLAGLALPLADLDYADWRRLSVLPVAKGDVDLPEQAMEELRRAGRATLTLFIDDAGSVVRARVEASNLPPEVESSVLRAFYRAPFSPGFIADRAVPSRLQVEVVFETGPSFPDASTLARADAPA